MASVAAAARAVRLLVPRRARASDQGVRSARPGRLPADRRRPSDRPRRELPTSWQAAAIGGSRSTTGWCRDRARCSCGWRRQGATRLVETSAGPSGVRRVLHRVRSAGIRAQAARGCTRHDPLPNRGRSPARSRGSGASSAMDRGQSSVVATPRLPGARHAKAQRLGPPAARTPERVLDDRPARGDAFHVKHPDASAERGSVAAGCLTQASTSREDGRRGFCVPARGSRRTGHGSR